MRLPKQWTNWRAAELPFIRRLTIIGLIHSMNPFNFVAWTLNIEYGHLLHFPKSSLTPLITIPDIIETETVEFENEKPYQNYFQERFYAESKGESLSTRSIEKASSKIVSLPNKILSHLENPADFGRVIGNVREPIINRGLHPQLRLQEARRMVSFKEGFESACAIRSYRRNNWAGRRNFHSLRSIKICVQRLAINRRMSH